MTAAAGPDVNAGVTWDPEGAGKKPHTLGKVTRETRGPPVPLGPVKGTKQALGRPKSELS